MPFARLPFVLLASLAMVCGAAHAAGEPAFVGKSDCRIAPIEPPSTRVGVSWKGACKDGYAEGKGVLEWYDQEDRKKRQLETVLVRGEISGSGKLTYPGGSYLGSFRRGVPHGAGYFEYADGVQYEGGVANGLPEGVGTRIDTDGSTYEGEFKAGKRHGRGKEVFTLGGRYEGDYRDGEFDGQGTIVYSSGRTWSGTFQDGRVAGATPLPQPADSAARSGVPVVIHTRNGRQLGTTPIGAEWEELTPGQKNLVRANYPTLDERDEPPHPRKGMKELYHANLSVYESLLHHHGDVLLHVTVGADGVPKTAKVYHTPHPDLGRYLAMAMMLQRFKPGLCAGTPCEMIYPVRFSFSDKES